MLLGLRLRSRSLSFLLLSAAFAAAVPDARAMGARPAADPPTPSRLPASMGALGDSITAGAIASYSREQASNPLVQTFLLGKLLRGILTKDFSSVESPDFSWSTGLDSRQRVMSHAQRLRALVNAQPDAPRFVAHNSAISGAVARTVRTRQLPELQAWSRLTLGQDAPDYVTLLIGPNDICADKVEDMTSTADYIADVSAVVDEMLEKSPRTRVLMVGLPNIASLQGVAREAKLIGRGHIAGTCGELWKTAKFCPTLTLEDDPANRAIIAERVLQYNEALANLATQRATQFGDRIRFADKVYGHAFTADDISIDCFHPGPRGQNILADESWKSSWWTQ
jgi:lysophospholipase L1-like esterase